MSSTEEQLPLWNLEDLPILRRRKRRKFTLSPAQLARRVEQLEFSLWNEDEMLQLREYVLMRSLATISTDLHSLDTEQDVLDWVHSDSIHPFSFRVCCEAACLDPDELREAVDYTMSRHSKH